MENHESLFRQEVIKERAPALYGHIVLSQPLSTKILTATLFVGIALIATWIFVGSYARIETVPGLLATNTPSAKVQIFSAGIVNDLKVKEGSRVNKGEVIARLRLDQQLENGTDAAVASLGNINAQIGLSEEQILIAKDRAGVERRRLESVVQGGQAQISSLRQQIDLQQQVVQSNDQIFSQLGTVIEKGFVSKFEYERRRQTLLASQQQLSALQQGLETRLAEVEQARAQLAALPIEARGQIASIKSNMQQLGQARTQLEGQRLINIVAPISGVVTNLVIADGRFAKPGTPLMSIVPAEAKLRAELYAPSRAIGFVKPGDEVRILYDAFPYQRFGSHPGVVSSVSKIVIDPTEADVPLKLEEAVFKIVVKLDRQTINGYGETIPLQPGMTLQANVILERQTFFDWLLTPLNAVLKRTS
jgi:membrane fusion protein